MPVIQDTSQEAALRLHRAAEPLDPPEDRIVIQTGWPGAAGFFVGDELFAAYEADLLLPAPATPNCRANAPCYQSLCGEDIVAAAGATAGSPGSFTPGGSVGPASVADLQDANPAIVASPTTRWTTGQFVQTGTPGAAGEAYWDGNSWESGRAPAPPPATGATAGAPGSWTPAGSAPPANVGAIGSVVASPATAWTTGQYVQTGTAGAPGEATWTGSAWVGGRAP